MPRARAFAFWGLFVVDILLELVSWSPWSSIDAHI